jgi:hypothetical protein
MSEEKYYDYLVLGGDHHGEVFTQYHTRILEVPLKDHSMAKFYSPDEPAETTVHKVVSYKVIEHIRDDKKHFFIATNDDLSNFDVEAEIKKARISPVN